MKNPQNIIAPHLQMGADMDAPAELTIYRGLDGVCIRCSIERVEEGVLVYYFYYFTIPHDQVHQFTGYMEAL